jgi:DNA mismatch endonuclease (patch repair protein)
MLRKALSQSGLRYKVQVRSLPGRPDVVFSRAQVAVFCDGDFWHGRNWRARRARLIRGSNADYWVHKISYNIARDKRQTRELERAGWVVVRVWETDVLRSPSSVVEKVRKALKRRGRAEARRTGETV